MKKYIQSLTIFLSLICITFSNAQSLSPEEIEKALTLYDQAMTQTEESISGLTEVQLNFKPSEESWSVAECLEHLTLSEEMFLQRLRLRLEEPAEPHETPENKLEDEKVYSMATNRSKKVKTGEQLEPTNKWGNTEATMSAFQDSRNQLKTLLKSTNKDFRSYIFETSNGTVDLYQRLLGMSGHHARHNAQIKEIMAHPDFPSR